MSLTTKLSPSGLGRTQLPLLSKLGVPATSQILTADSQKLNFSILSKVPFYAQTLPTQPEAEPVRGLRGQSLRVEGHGPIMIILTFLKSL